MVHPRAIWVELYGSMQALALQPLALQPLKCKSINDQVPLTIVSGYSAVKWWYGELLTSGISTHERVSTRTCSGFHALPGMDNDAPTRCAMAYQSSAKTCL